MNNFNAPKIKYFKKIFFAVIIFIIAYLLFYIWRDFYATINPPKIKTVNAGEEFSIWTDNLAHPVGTMEFVRYDDFEPPRGCDHQCRLSDGNLKVSYFLYGIRVSEKLVPYHFVVTSYGENTASVRGKMEKK